MASELTNSIQRQRWMDIKGHSGKEQIQKRSIHKDRVYFKRTKETKVAFSSLMELEANYDTTNLLKWLKKS